VFARSTNSAANELMVGAVFVHLHQWRSCLGGHEAGVGSGYKRKTDFCGQTDVVCKTYTYVCDCIDL